jgi:hypothetical protein
MVEAESEGQTTLGDPDGRKGTHSGGETAGQDSRMMQGGQQEQMKWKECQREGRGERGDERSTIFSAVAVKQVGSKAQSPIYILSALPASLDTRLDSS